MPAKLISSALLGAAALALAGCGQAAEEQEQTAGTAVTSSPNEDPGVPQQELDTRQAVSDIGTAARSLVDATDVTAARDAVGTIEQRLSDKSKELPEALATGVKADMDSAREALAADDLAGAKAAGNAIIERMRTSATLTDPTLVNAATPAPGS